MLEDRTFDRSPNHSPLQQPLSLPNISQPLLTTLKRSWSWSGDSFCRNADPKGSGPLRKTNQRDPRQPHRLLRLAHVRRFCLLDSKIGIELASVKLKAALRCLIVSVINRTICLSKKGYGDERVHKGTIHDGPPFAEEFSRNGLGGSGDGGICGNGCECSGKDKHAKSGTRSFIE
jgi:hypothetical protein